MIDGGSAADDRARGNVASHAALRGNDRAVADLTVTDDANLSRENYVIADIG